MHFRGAIFKGLLMAPLLLAACSAAATPENGGRRVISVTVGGTERSYILRLPPKYDGKTPLPSVILIHGASDSAAYAEEAYHFAEKAADQNFVLVIPDGVNHSFDGLGAAPNNDVDFITLLLNDLPKQYAIDRGRIYIAGHSAGAVMTYRMAIEHPDQIAAIGIVAGYVDPKWQKPKIPVPVILFHGKKDPNIPIEYLAPAVEFWHDTNGCGDPQREIKPAYTHYSFGSQKHGDMEAYVLENGNHMWPGGKIMPGKTQEPVQDLSATDLMWGFFKAHPRSAR